jgi:hypothetical protein
MKKLLTMGIMLTAFISTSLAQAPGSFRHPGIFNSQTELDFIKSTVAANNGSPIIAGYQTLSNDSKGSLGYNPEPYAVVNVVASGSSPAELAFRRDAHAAYIHAIKWVVTGNSAHRDKSIQIMNAWSYMFQSLSTAPDKPNQPTLEASWALPIWLAGAEIIKTYNGGAAGWSAADQSKFESYARKILTYVNGPIASAPNWYISKGLSLLAAGVYLNEASTFNAGYNIIVPQLDAITTSGQIPELTRDFVHSQYVLIGLAQAAEVAYQQGNTALFTRTNGASQPRLLLGTEHYTRCLMGTNTPNYQSDSQWARKSAPYEILLLRYTQLGMSVPNTSNYVLNQNRVENGVEDHFLGYHTATHSQAPTAPQQSPYTGSPLPIPGKIEAENYDNGGQDVAYSDNTTGNTGNVYRFENVDIQATTDPGGGYAIGWIAQGEWLEYTVNVNTAGTYTLTARVSATASGKTFHVELNGQNISGPISVPVTGSFQTYATTVNITTPALTTGQKTLRIVMDASSFNINYLNFALNGSSSNIALNKTAVASSVEATGFEASKAVDGNATTTRWSSAFSDPQWIYVDLGAEYAINRVKITWEAAYATAYQIQVSSTTSGWTTMRSVTGNTSLVNDQTGLSGTGRYVRINGTARATVYGYSIFELEVYGTPTGGRSAVDRIEEAGSESKAIVYPNPTKGKVTVNTERFQNGMIALCNSDGKRILSEKIKGITHTFHLEGLPAGLYLINLSDAQKRDVLKVVKE